MGKFEPFAIMTDATSRFQFAFAIRRWSIFYFLFASWRVSCISYRTKCSCVAVASQNLSARLLLKLLCGGHSGRTAQSHVRPPLHRRRRSTESFCGKDKTVELVGGGGTGNGGLSARQSFQLNVIGKSLSIPSYFFKPSNVKEFTARTRCI